MILLEHSYDLMPLSLLGVVFLMILGKPVPKSSKDKKGKDDDKPSSD